MTARIIRHVFLTLLFLLGSCETENPTTVLPQSRQAAGNAAVSMPDEYAAEVSQRVLLNGGNAVDAAVASGFVLAVTYPEAGNIGGGGFMLIRMNGESSFLDYREVAPMGSNRGMYLDDDGNVIANASLVGIHAVGVPGTVAGLWAAHARFGSLPWRDLVQPAIELATDGFIVPAALVEEIAAVTDMFADQVTFFEYFGNLNAGNLLRQPELARTLTRIAKSGPVDFYTGETARLLVNQMQRDGGLITMNDLRDYEVAWRDPVEANWRDYQIVSAPPPSSGGFAVIQLLKMKEALQLQFSGLHHNSVQYVHLVAEMLKRVYADRAEYLGDPDFVDVRIDELLANDYINNRAQNVNAEEISALEASSPGLESPNTTHYSIVDQWGNAVSNTYTLNWSFGGGVVVEQAGFLLNNEMDDFSVKPGVANVYGVVGSTANEIQPGKRMLSSMAPTFLIRDNRITMVVGTPGGSTIPSTVFQCITSILDFGMTPAEAVAVSRFNHQLLPPDLITYSPSRPLSPAVIAGLDDKGYRARPHAWEFGNLQIIVVDGDNIDAASDPRGRGESRVFQVHTTQ